MRDRREKQDDGPGVPEAVPRGLQHLLGHYGAESLDRVWIFPPLVSGRKEWGLLVASVYIREGDPERRLLASVPYTAERTGRGLELHRDVQEHGEAPPDRFPRVVDGVVRRAEKDLGEPREVEVSGNPAALVAVLGEFDRDLLDPELPPLAPEPDPTPETVVLGEGGP